MEENKVYELNLEKIYDDFKFTDNSLTHSQCKKLKLLPFAANDKTLFTKFDGVVGEVSRLLCNKKLESDFNALEFIENVVDEIGEFEGDTSKESFRNIIKTMFIDNDNLANFDIKTINYISSTSSEEKIAKFIYSIFFTDELKNIIEKYYNRDVDNILYKLVLKALPKLKEKQSSVDKYICYIPFINELFVNDFKFLIQDEELYKNSLNRFLEFYYLFYISQLSMKLSQFEKANLENPEKLYFTLSWESMSKNRTAYLYGWEKLKGYVESLFSHAITLEFLNHSNFDKQLGYVELFKIFNTNEEKIQQDIDKLCDEYISRRQEGIIWDGFTVKRGNSGNKAFDKVYRLFESIEHQFQGKASTRTRAYNAYSNWFVKFVQDNFGKRRGSLGYSLNLNEEDIILLTKICINNKKRLKLNLLFKEFEKRGISFDRDSKIKIIQLYEKLNLLEKKSDSGDAQYVRSIL
ncbi:DNA phosphorothioation-dependent restriction protein DptG [Clostridium taeniosporum]|uniref:DNA phosphorothioation-dependent restriction protein DptG n=1 Tax=Clostridium taeniosporum TaxID=394958 RepID=A0A1D7XKA0_9CLOT|nr:DNA phosphorothioation-dependent restriction protein DptG [Clostridium taeniosporum]AOR23771.1 DNA phosphorothioation-dependent restriction protein DptG [Clostridium taeniosporum]